MNSILDYLTFHARLRSNSNVFTFIDEKEHTNPLTFRELLQDVEMLATKLRTHVEEGDRVVIQLPSGLEYIKVFFACLRAGVIAVPLYPARGDRFSQRIAGIVYDCDASLVINNVLYNSGLEGRKVLSYEGLLASPGTHFERLDVESRVAFLQYTSGSTGAPKGVMISHANILANCELISELAKVSEESVFCNWLPFYHDLGMVTTILLAVHSGFHSILISQYRFMMKPIIWLESISKFKATHGGAPNFAYDHCVEKIKDNQLQGLDLSSWKVAYNAGEPVNANTLQRFVNRFAVAGFNERAYVPSYGMAEATVNISIYDVDNVPVVGWFDKQQLKLKHAVRCSEERGRAIVACGVTNSEHDIQIVDPETGERLGDGDIGEIWFSGPSVSQGYWNRPELNQTVFTSLIPGISNREYLRTGDLGFKKDDELYVSGRMKDMFIIRGRNYFPSDIERDAEAAFPDLCLNSAVAFETNGNANILIEIERKAVKYFDVSLAAATIRAAILEEHELLLTNIVFLRAGKLPVTSSGKVQRILARKMFIDGALEALVANTEEIAEDESATCSECERRMTDICKAVLQIEQIGLHENLFDRGAQSLSASLITAKIAEEFDRDITLSELLLQPSVYQLAKLVESKDVATQKCDAHSTIAEFVRNQNPYTPFPLTDVQHAYWMGRKGGFDIAGVGTHGYYEVVMPAFDANRYQQAWRCLIARHPMLRMVIGSDGQQRIQETVPPFMVEQYDLSKEDTRGQAQHFEKLRAEMSHQCFSGEQWPLFDIRATHLGEGKSVVHYSMDALPLDASSALILEQELALLYETPDASLPPFSFSFRDYVLMQESLKSGEQYQRAQRYWTSRLDTLPARPELPLTADPSSIVSPRFERRRQSLVRSQWEALKEIARQHKVTPTVLFLTCFSHVLNRWSENRRFTLNLTLFDRKPLDPQVHAILGDFTATSLLALDFSDPTLAFEEQLTRIQTQLWQDLDHSEYTGIEVQRALSRNTEIGADFPIVVTSTLGLDSGGGEQASIMSGVDVQYGITQTSQVWLDVQVYEVAGALHYNWDSVQGLFAPGVLDAMLAALHGLFVRLTSVSAACQQPQQVELPVAQSRLLAQVNDTHRDLAQGVLHGLLLQQICLRGDKVAIKTRHKTLTYAELGTRSYALACALAGQVTANTLVAVVMEKGWQQVVALLGVLRAGAAYMPVDAELPEERIGRLLTAGEGAYVITTRAFAHKIPETYRVLFVDETFEVPHFATPVSLVENSPADWQTQRDHLAYVIFTSGSTGAPKGVMIKHAAALNTIEDINQRFQVTHEDSVLGLSNFSFDLSVYDIFGVLGAGGTLVLPQGSESRDPLAWKRWLIEEQVTIWNTAPPLMQVLMESVASGQPEADSKLRLCLLSGDWIPVDLPARISAYSPGVEVISLGGATEASVWSIYYPIREVAADWVSIPYGQALANQQVYVLHDDLSACPVWVRGDIYIGGQGVAEGYWRDKAKTDAAFITHPEHGYRMYKTGDKGRLRPDGNIEFLGRVDSQVKIQGHRIELGEIEAALKSHKDVKEALVHVHEVDGRKSLLAYLVGTESNRAVTQEGLDVGKVEFQLAQHGVRKEAWSYQAVSKVPGLADVLSMLQRRGYTELALPKGYYPSGGSLYPVQVYVSISRGVGTASGEEALVDGYYYYHPIRHELGLIVPHAEGDISHEDMPFKVCLAADMRAIAPVYGEEGGEALSRLECGYMSHLLGQVCDWQVCVPDEEVAGVARWASRCELTEHHQVLRVLGSTGEDIEPRVLARDDYAARKSYRFYLDEAPSSAQVLGLLSHLSEGMKAHASRLSYYLFIRRTTLATDLYGALVAGVYRYHLADKQLELIAGQRGELEALATSYNQEIEARASLGIYLVDNEPNARDEALYLSGQVGQLLYQESAGLGLGLCALGEVDDTLCRHLFALSSQQRVVHSFVGGAISEIQRRAMVSLSQRDDLATSVQAHIQQLLPGYMVPSGITVLDQFPLNSSGKIDRKRLPLLQDMVADRLYVAPQTEVQRLVCRIFEDVLSIGQVGIEGSLFDLGGDSLSAIRIISKINDELDIRVEIKELFAATNISIMCDIVESQLAAKSDYHDLCGNESNEGNLETFVL